MSDKKLSSPVTSEALREFFTIPVKRHVSSICDPVPHSFFMPAKYVF